jgi:hypothetical protein
VSEPPRRWQDVPSDQQVNEARAELYERLIEAEEQIAHALYRRGVDHAAVEAALDAIDERMSDDERREDLYLSALSHYIEALGGRLEVRAVFDDAAIVVRRAPEEPRA